MAILIPSEWLTIGTGALALAPGPLVRYSHVKAIVLDAHLCRATRMRCVWARAYSVTAGAAYATVVDEAPVTCSAATSGSLLIVIRGERINARVTITDGATTTSAVATKAGAGTAFATATLTSAALVGGAQLRLMLEVQRTAAPDGTLIGISIFELDRSSV